MGDIADYYQTAYACDIIDELGYEYSPHPQTKTCKYCGQSGLHWLQTPEGWRLSSRGVVHSCPYYRKRIVPV